MAPDKHHIINLSNNGTFRYSGNFSSTHEDVDFIFRRLEETGASHLTLYFHGGLVSETRGLQTAERLIPTLKEKAGTYPVFFVWESGWFDVTSRNLHNINLDKLFQALFKIILKFVAAKLKEHHDSRGEKLDLDRDREILEEIQSSEPFFQYEDEAFRQNLAPLSDTQIEQFEEYIQDHGEYRTAVVSILSAMETEEESRGGYAIGGERAAPEDTMLSGEVLKELQEEVKEGGRGLLSSATLVGKALNVLKRVVQRLINKTDHGVYCTVVEEILRELYIDKTGGWLWRQMKHDIQSAFKDNTGLSGEALHGGSYFLEQLQAYGAAHPSLKVSLVGHSAGAIYICRLIEKAVDLFGENFRLHRVIFLAPAVDFELFHSTIMKKISQIQSFRMFAMADRYEARDVLVPVIYPRSLLYLISGLLEGKEEKPLVGMNRFYSGRAPYDGEKLRAVRDFMLDENHDRVVWSVATGGASGFNSAADSHGGFDDDGLTIQSIVKILSME